MENPKKRREWKKDRKEVEKNISVQRMQLKSGRPGCVKVAAIRTMKCNVTLLAKKKRLLSQRTVLVTGTGTVVLYCNPLHKDNLIGRPDHPETTVVFVGLPVFGLSRYCETCVLSVARWEDACYLSRIDAWWGMRPSDKCDWLG